MEPVRHWDIKMLGINDNIRFLIYSKVFTMFREWISKFPYVKINDMARIKILKKIKF